MRRRLVCNVPIKDPFIPGYATDKDIRDVVLSTQQLTVSKMLKLLRGKGIILSADLSREQLAFCYAAQFTHDMYDLRDLLEEAPFAPKQESITSVQLEVALQRDQVIKAIDAFMADVAENGDEQIIITGRGDKNHELQVTYHELDYSRTFLKQKIPRTGLIQLVASRSTITLRRPDNDTMMRLEAKLLEKLQEQLPPDQKGTEHRIDLRGLNTAKSRTKFFTELISSIPGFKLKNVTKVYLHRFADKPSLKEEVEPEDETKEELEEELRQALDAWVQRATATGSRLLDTEFYRRLEQEGYALHGIRWTSEEAKAPHDRVIFDVAVRDPETGSGFHYKVLGAHKKKPDGSYLKTPKKLTDSEVAEVNASIEVAAQQALTIAKA
jgi:hypothetical protein